MSRAMNALQLDAYVLLCALQGEQLNLHIAYGRESRQTSDCDHLAMDEVI